MDKNEITPNQPRLPARVFPMCLPRARKNAKTAVNLSMVYAYFEIGRMIVEEEQHGANRAAYGYAAFERAVRLFDIRTSGKAFPLAT